MKVLTIEIAVKVLRNAAECGYDEQSSYEFAWYADRLEELKAYRSTGYTPEQIRELQAENAKLKQQMQEDEESFCCMP